MGSLNRRGFLAIAATASGLTVAIPVIVQASAPSRDDTAARRDRATDTENRVGFEERLAGCLYGVAIGDGMGGPVEGWSPSRIREKFHDWDMTRFLPTQEWKPKGDGRITDDTLMTEALIRAYNKKRDHFDAFDYRDYLLPEMTSTVVWLPEWQKETPIIERMNFIEKYTVIRLHNVGAEPRIAGVGNGINCAIAMFIMPVGALNSAVGLNAELYYNVECPPGNASDVPTHRCGVRKNERPRRFDANEEHVSLELGLRCSVLHRCLSGRRRTRPAIGSAQA